MDERNEQPDGAPVGDFSNCHSGILQGLDALAELPGLYQAAVRARAIAEHVEAVFDDAVIEHHSQEEEELFPAVLASARPGAELDKVKEIIGRLTHEHREVEAMWKHLAPQVKKVAKGQSVALDVEEVERLVRTYAAHARYEETVFLPLSVKILGRNANHMAALGLSMHMRHTPSVTPYV